MPTSWRMWSSRVPEMIMYRKFTSLELQRREWWWAIKDYLFVGCFVAFIVGAAFVAKFIVK